MTTTVFPTPSFSPKRLAERKKFSFDFTNELATAETISTAVVTATVYKGTDSNPAAIVSGTATIAGNVVTQLIIDGVENVTYLIVCEVTTSNGQKLHGTALLLVTDKVQT